MKKLEESTVAWPTNGFPATLSAKTRRVYDLVAGVYPLSTMFFHSNAHRCALEISGIRNGMRVLEVATGSGEMFDRLVRANRHGFTMGVDLSPNMAARTQKRVRETYPYSRAYCQAVDARRMPFRDESFDAVVCCYLLELLATEDIVQTVDEFYRVLRNRGKLVLVLIGENTPVFNRMYRFAGKVAPAFWGRQVEEHVPTVIEGREFTILQDRTVRQSGYPSRVIAAHK